MKLRDKIVVVMAVALFAASLITSMQSNRMMALQLGGDRYIETYSAPGGTGGWFGSAVGYLFGSWAGTWVAHNIR